MPVAMAQSLPQAASHPAPAPAPLDDRFSRLVGDAAWAQLPAAVRRRFSKRLLPGEVILYSGRVESTELSWAGRVLALIAHVIGGPLPDTPGATGTAVVSVSELDGETAQIWTRTYARPGRFPQVVHSMKRFAGVTGLEEYVGSGIGMALDVSVEEGALVFRPRFYFVEFAGRRLRVPAALEPGQMRIVHRDLGQGAFDFDLSLTHRRLGVLVAQRARFKDQ